MAIWIYKYVTVYFASINIDGLFAQCTYGIGLILYTYIRDAYVFECHI